MWAAVLSRAFARGELPPGNHADLLVEALPRRDPHPRALFAGARDRGVPGQLSLISSLRELLRNSSVGHALSMDVPLGLCLENISNLINIHLLLGWSANEEFVRNKPELLTSNAMVSPASPKARLLRRSSGVRAQVGCAYTRAGPLTV